jgi:NADPH:quinone reductase-like Zn-dependent oxidoreductase
LIRESGGTIIVTAGKEAKLAACRELGADLAVNYRQEEFVERTQAFTQGKGIDIILDMVGAPYLERNLSLLRTNGRLVFIATLGGSQAEIDLRALMGRRLRLIGSVLRSRSLEEKVALKAGFMERFWSLLEAGTIQPVIDVVFPIQEADQAHRHMADYGNVGKIVLKVR